MHQVSFGEIEGLFGNRIELSRFMDELPLGVVITDLDRRILFYNRQVEILTGFDRDEVWGVPCRHVMRSNLCHQKCPAAELGECVGSTTIQGDLINRDRRKIQVRISAVSLRDTDGKPVGFMETMEDITSQEKQVLKSHLRHGFGRLLGRCPQMEELFSVIPVIAQTDSSVLLTGETGTGKDVLAEGIHQASNRSSGSFIKINSGALPETLLESELFGHMKGAFTGAVSDKPGRIRLAHGGTLYLTEIGDLPLTLQVKLLTFLDDKIVYPLGGIRGFQADVRIIAATHRNLERMVREGRFREDLLYRLNVIRLHLPPLRERGEDIGLLVDHFIKTLAARFGKHIKGLSERCREILFQYSYPGNVRELKNVIEYAVNLCQEKHLGPEHLPAYIVENRSEAGEDGVVESGDSSSSGDEPDGEVPKTNWADMERRMIMEALVRARGRKSKAAEALGWCRSTLWRKLKQHGIDE